MMSETNPSGMSEQDPKQENPDGAISDETSTQGAGLDQNAGMDEGGRDTSSEMDEGAGSAMGDAMGSGGPGGMDDMGDSGVDEDTEEES
ncbi:hypothetical protein [Cryobacterium sp. BB307]|uniref:hypothetical protein n=1 Tax=Cryobacterium sp. BB307 TaxID=2716317 RepID=UPI00144727E6|nr:hypothetical protein [Cryobacterium sp. BB307]